SGLFARDVGSPWMMLLLWVAGGAIAMVGAQCFAELGAQMPEAGGEYVYLREAYGAKVAYLSGWTSFFVGFSGAIAASLLAFATYLQQLVPAMSSVDSRIVALGTLWILTGAHAVGARPGARLQALMVGVTLAVLLGFVAAGFSIGRGSSANFFSSGPVQGSAAVSLIFVLYTYSGWNAAAYLAGEIVDPARGIPKALISGTAVVTLVYVALNLTYIWALSIPKMSGVLTIGERAAAAMFGPLAARAVAGVIALAILSSASAMVMAGPRVYFAMARDGVFPALLGTISGRFKTPACATIAQSAWTTILILFFGAFEPLVIFTGPALTIFA